MTRERIPPLFFLSYTFIPLSSIAFPHIAIFCLTARHMSQFKRVRELMEKAGIGDRLLTGGGIIPTKDQEALAKIGVGRLFGPGDDPSQIVEYIRDWMSKHQRVEVM